jgi:2-polyprenyl-3-methyl-5-hydroxy-6-metoxy-1,4-benzoquinol methylase
MVKEYPMFKLGLFKKKRKDHWERAYEKTAPTDVGWYQDYPELSIKLIGNTGIRKDGSVIDVGGGTSKLSGYLLDQGYSKLTVLDISGQSIEKAKSNLGEKSLKIKWFETDVTNYHAEERYDIWHDRAVFHFLTKKEDRISYINTLNQTLKLNGHLIIATFSLDAPKKCSGLSVVRYSQDTLQKELGANFNLEEYHLESHVTPSGAKQQFIYCRFIKVR